MADAPHFLWEAITDRLRGCMSEELGESGLRGASQRILLADDDPGSLEGMRSRLVAGGCEVETAEDGRAGLDEVGVIHRSMVITDGRVAEVTGRGLWGACRGAE